MQIENEASGSSSAGETHLMRITQHGKMQSFIQFALKFLTVSLAGLSAIQGHLADYVLPLRRTQVAH